MINCGLVESTNKSKDIVQQKVTLPPVTKYLQKLDEILFSEETLVEIFYVAPSTKEVEEDLSKTQNIGSEQKDADIFVASLYEQYGVHVEGFTHLQVD